MGLAEQELQELRVLQHRITSVVAVSLLYSRKKNLHLPSLR